MPTNHAMQWTKPPRLRAGGRVALVAPAGPIDPARLENAVALCAALGLEPHAGSAALDRTGYLAGPDHARAADLQNALDDPSVDAVWALRGGYGSVRLLPHIDFTRVCSRPKAYIGFSDNTSVHLALARRGIVSFHAPHAGGEFPPFASDCFRRVLFDGESGILPTPADAPMHALHGGIADGVLVGGNLSLLAAAAGTPISLSTLAPHERVILFFEEIAEPPYRIDRMLTQLLDSSAFDRVAGIVIGQMTDCDDQSGDALDVIMDRLAALDVPMVAGAPIGHVPDNWTLPVGVRARIDADACTLALLESAVSHG